jgi:hypothetical protein
VRTLKGYEAVEVAGRYGVLLYDLEHKCEVSAEQAKEYIENRRDPNVFVLQRWPDTEEEAEQIVLKEFQKALQDKHWAAASVWDISNDLPGGLPIHLAAAELAAKRLVEQGKLLLVDAGKDYNVYCIPRTVRFSQSFLDQLRSVLCDECAALDLSGEFHEACMMNLIDFMKNHTFTFNDVVEVEPTKSWSDRLPKVIRPAIGMQLLSKAASVTSKAASVTKAKWKNVLKPILSPENKEYKPAVKPDPQPGHLQEATFGGLPQEVHHASPATVAEPGVPDERPKVTKAELIRYLQSVEIVEEQGDLARLHREREELRQQLAAKEQQIEKIDRQRAFVERQFQELQRDMDILLEAMQIAKRREQKPQYIVDGTFESTDS